MSTAALGVSAEQYALGHLRRHRDAMSRPDMQNIADDSGLTVREVAALWEQLLADRVPKTLDRPRAAPAPSPLGQNAATPARPVETPAPSSWLSAKDHPSARIRGKYKRAVAAVADLEAALAAEGEKDKLREKEARLAAQLAKVRAELRGGGSSMPRSESTAARVPCPGGCGKDFAGAHGIVMHRARTGCGAT
jgi:hypothetical protein